MFKSKIVFFAAICLAVIFHSCSDDIGDGLQETSDLQEEETLVLFEVADAETAAIFQAKNTEVNDTKSRKLALVGPDLIISRIATTFPINVTPCAAGPMPDANCGVNYSYWVDVRNIGNQTAPGGHTVAFWYSGANGGAGGLQTRTVNPALAPGQSTTIFIGTSPVCGPVLPSIEQFIGFADLTNVVAEINETNNRSRAYNFCLN